MASDLAHALAAATDLPLWQAELGVKAIFREIVLLTNQGDVIRIPKFGTFFLTISKARSLESNLPQLQGKLVTVPARRRLVFRPTRARNRQRRE